MKNVVITGVSSGIGYALTADLITDGYHVFGSVRKQVDVDRLQAEFGEGFTPLIFDVTDEAAVKTAASNVHSVIGDTGLKALVNNAGIATPGPLMHLPLEELDLQLQVNVKSVLAVTQAFLPLLGATKNRKFAPGRIINIGSVSGKIVYPFLGSYAISKHALEAMSDALRRELIIYGIDVVLLEAGSIRTPIWDKAEQVDTSKYAHTDYGKILAGVQKAFVKRGRSGIPVERVVSVIREAMENDRPKTRYVLARKLMSGWILPRFLPDRWFDRMVTRRMGLKRIV